jgi:hypothetical protein
LCFISTFIQALPPILSLLKLFELGTSAALRFDLANPYAANWSFAPLSKGARYWIKRGDVITDYCCYPFPQKDPK